ncbi:MAG: hypothetical protein LBE59_07155 [Nevskiaceae bacterium]|jgi:hypothetical protein|nr:hypothetical protein [Nevskiaceae bacterium]
MNTQEGSLEELTGVLLLWPGEPAPHSLHSTRRPLVSCITAGQSAAALPSMLASLFNLCGHAHRLCSRLAIDAAAPGLLDGRTDIFAEDLRRETAAEHIRRIAMDWPALLSGGDTQNIKTSLSLHACPLLKTPAQTPVEWSAVHDWLQLHWLGIAPATWLQQWKQHGSYWLEDWSRGGATWLSALLRESQSADVLLPIHAVPALSIADDWNALRELGQMLEQHGDDFIAAPQWRGRCAHTGVWSRLHDASPRPPRSTWTLLGSRIAELICLCLPTDGPHGGNWLRWGALSTGHTKGLAWVEMARGLLIHQVSLHIQASDRAQVKSCQVLAPTEWNFHPEGIAARTLASLPAHMPNTAARIQLLMAALDPCLPFRVAPTTRRAEAARQVHHA